VDEVESSSSSGGGVPESRSATLGVWRWTRSRVYQRARPVRRPQESASSRSISAGIISLLI